MEKTRLYISMYHYVRDLSNSRYPKIKGLDVKLFREQIKFLKQRFYIARMDEVIAAIRGEISLPENSALLTFDDGYIDHYTNVLPILHEENVQGSFFIPGKTFDTYQLLDVNKIHFILACAETEQGGVGGLFQDVLAAMDYYRGSEFEFPSNAELLEKYAKANRFDTKETIFIKRMLQTVLPERLRLIITSDLFLKYVNLQEEKFARELYMSEAQIKLMQSSGMYIGVHGYDHYWLADLSYEAMAKDIDRALLVMEPFIEKGNWVMNYPYGSYNETVMDYIQGKGCCLGLSTKVNLAIIDEQMRQDKYMRYQIPRFDCNDFPPKSENYQEYCKRI